MRLFSVIVVVAVLAVAVLVVPRVVTGIRNGQGIAWSTEAGERVLLADHGLAVTREEEALTLTGRDLGLPYTDIGDTLRLVDPRTGKQTDSPVAVDADEVVEALAREVTADSAKTGVAPGRPVLLDHRDDGVLADGRVYRTAGLQPGSVAATATQVGWSADQPVFARADTDGAEVHDRRSGRRVVRLVGDEVYIRTVGERLVITADDRDHVVAT